MLAGGDRVACDEPRMVNAIESMASDSAALNQPG
jgi:hypothetical protein